MGYNMVGTISQQGSDLIELRLTWREMDNLIFGGFMRSFGDTLEDFSRIFEEFWRIFFHCERINNFHQLETNKENEVLRPL